MFVEKFGQPVKNEVHYYYGVSLIEEKQYEDQTEQNKEDEQNADFVDNDTGNNSVVDPGGLDFNL